LRPLRGGGTPFGQKTERPQKYRGLSVFQRRRPNTRPEGTASRAGGFVFLYLLQLCRQITPVSCGKVLSFGKRCRGYNED
jgi:hypothetical protein